MIKRVRSPNYPSMSLPEAVQKVGEIYQKQNMHGVAREVLAQNMGYTGLNGASASAISALHKYGLLEGRGEDVRVSERAMQILHADNPEERAQALREAAVAPDLFRELDGRYPVQAPSDDALKSYLSRRGFSPKAISEVIRGYRETKEFIDRGEKSDVPRPAVTKPGNADEPDVTVAQGYQVDKRSTPLVTRKGEPIVEPGRFTVSMNDEFLVDISARQLGRQQLEKLVSWINANIALAPSSDVGEPQDDEANGALNVEA